MQLPKAIRVLTPGWWLIHLAAMSIVYALGNLLWK